MSQQFAEQNKELEQRFEKVDKRLEKVDQQFERIEAKIDDLSESVAEALDASNTTTHEQLDNHESRITKLEQSVPA